MASKNGIISNYQAVVPSTWNSGPRNFNDEVDRMSARWYVRRMPIQTNRWKWFVPFHSFDPVCMCGACGGR
ncbi:nickel-dependent hydrogenase large subunit [Shigella flexneri]